MREILDRTRSSRRASDAGGRCPPAAAVTPQSQISVLSMVNWRDLIRRPSKKHDDASRAVEEEALAIVPCKRFEDR